MCNSCRHASWESWGCKFVIHDCRPWQYKSCGDCSKRRFLWQQMQCIGKLQLGFGTHNCCYSVGIDLALTLMLQIAGIGHTRSWLACNSSLFKWICFWSLVFTKTLVYLSSQCCHSHAAFHYITPDCCNHVAKTLRRAGERAGTHQLSHYYLSA